MERIIDRLERGCPHDRRRPCRSFSLLRPPWRRAIEARRPSAPPVAKPERRTPVLDLESLGAYRLRDLGLAEGRPPRPPDPLRG